MLCSRCRRVQCCSASEMQAASMHCDTNSGANSRQNRGLLGATQNAHTRRLPRATTATGMHQPLHSCLGTTVEPAAASVGLIPRRGPPERLWTRRGLSLTTAGDGTLPGCCCRIKGKASICIRCCHRCHASGGASSALRRAKTDDRPSGALCRAHLCDVLACAGVEPCQQL